MKQSLLLFYISLSLGIIPSAYADSTLEYTITENGSKSSKLQSVIIKDGKILLKGADGNSKLDFLYSSYSTTPGQLSIIDHSKRSVMLLDDNQINKLVKQAETVQPILQGFSEQLAQLDPIHRAKWEKLLGGKISLEKLAAGTKPTQPEKLVKSGKMLNVAGIACEQTNIFRGTTKMAEFCLTEPSKLEMSDADYATLRALLSFLGEISNKGQGLMKQFGVNVPNFDVRNISGVPIQLTDISKPGEASIRLSRTSKATVPTDIMEIPESYRSEPFTLWQ